MYNAQVIFMTPPSSLNQKFVTQLRRNFSEVIHLPDLESFEVMLHNPAFRFELLIADSSLLSTSFADSLQSYKIRHADPLLICVGPYSSEIMHKALHYGFDEFFAALPGGKQLMKLLQQHQMKVNK
ncbi:MAG: hypothetical protein PHG67_12390 [Bacteroidales bacterium]|nr:hypothetical protein [Bacteroidales bacterium]